MEPQTTITDPTNRLDTSSQSSEPRQGLNSFKIEPTSQLEPVTRLTKPSKVEPTGPHQLTRHLTEVEITTKPRLRYVTHAPNYLQQYHVEGSLPARNVPLSYSVLAENKDLGIGNSTFPYDLEERIYTPTI
ncbi:hypothetical protein LWI29_035341 [Acer saccharum]|uniref:Uncharacterized protein n=1 Tax=Acer saccharum TaxID=4024 RepID=A0AA39SB44_ACESA|nr:hypothetical protein LWI29_035341 [Acer saccharum]